MSNNNLQPAGGSAANSLLGATAGGNVAFCHPAGASPGVSIPASAAVAAHVVPQILSAPGCHPSSMSGHPLAALMPPSMSMMIPCAASPVQANPVVGLLGAAQAAAAGYQAALAAAAVQQQQQQQGHHNHNHHLAISQAQAQALAFSQAALLTSSNPSSTPAPPLPPTVIAPPLQAQRHHHPVVPPSGGAHGVGGDDAAVAMTVPSLPAPTTVPSGGAVPAAAGLIPPPTTMSTTTTTTTPAVGDGNKSPTPPVHPATTTAGGRGSVAPPSVVSTSGSVCSVGHRSLSSTGGGAGSSSSSPWCPIVKELTPLEEARLRQDKKAAKRIANRKSASNSRARRKAYVEELAQTNARLRRQALILSHIPDLVLTVAASDGTISFASDQVERTLKRRGRELVGTSLYEAGEGGLLAPASREVVRRLVRALVGATANDGAEGTLSTTTSPGVSGKVVSSGGGEAGNDDGRCREENRQPHSVSCGAAETALSCVTGSTDFGATVSEMDNSERSICNGESSLRDKACIDVGAASGGSNPPGASLAQAQTKGSNLNVVNGGKASFDANMTSSGKESSRLTFERLKQHSASEKDFTAESSAMNVNGSKTNDINENSSLDSGYRASSSDSFPSRQESMSSSDDILIDGKNGVAPSCNVCLLGENGTPMWCEVTASVGSSENGGESDPDAASNSQGETEVLLCLRPIKYSKGKVPNGLGFQSLPKKSVKKASRRRERKRMAKQCASAAVGSFASQKCKDANSNDSLVVCEALLVLSPSKGPPKKRNFVPEPISQPAPQKKLKASIANEFRCMPNSLVPCTSGVGGNHHC